MIQQKRKAADLQNTCFFFKVKQVTLDLSKSMYRTSPPSTLSL